MKNVTEAFDLYAEDYDNWFDTPEGKVLFEMEVEAVRLLMGDIEKPFLEIGVGTGRFAKELGIDYGIDPSHTVLEIAEKRGIKIKEAKGENLPFKDEFFGGVFILFTLCFVEDPGKVFSEAKRVLKQNGRLIVGIINRESSWGKFYLKKKEAGHPIYRYARFYSVDEIIKMAERAGVEIEAYSSTLFQQPTEMPYEEKARNELVVGAGFICILTRKG